MIKKLLLLFLFIFSSTISTFSYAKKPTAIVSEKHLECAPELRGVLAKIQQLEEVNALIAKATKDGAISIERNRYYSNKFDGYWEGSSRTIYLSKTNPSNQIVTLLFELHNAARDKDLEHIDTLAYQRKIKKKHYIEKIEYIEYENALATASLLKKGIKQGIFPSNSYWEISDNFSEHFAIQKSSGHSKWIGKVYDDLSWH